jgi:prephenate dehydratase
MEAAGTNAAAPVVVAYQGRAGAFSDVAARELVPGARTRGYDSFDAVAAALAAGEVDYGVLPVENAIAGPVPRNYELLWEHPALRVRGETALPVELCLIGAPSERAGASGARTDASGTYAEALESIREVRSHPVALEQVRGLIAAHPGWRRSVTTDTAGAVAEIVALGDPAVAAIGPALAAELYGGTILARGVQDARENYTRFFLLARGDDDADPRADAADPQGDDIVSPGTRACVGIAVADRPGSLRDALSAFADRGIDLRFLIARPDRSVPFRYRFFVELNGVDDARLAAALRDIGGEQRVFGRY